LADPPPAPHCAPSRALASSRDVAGLRATRSLFGAETTAADGGDDRRAEGNGGESEEMRVTCSKGKPLSRMP